MDREQKIAWLSRMLDDPNENPDILGIYLDLAGDKILNRMYPFTTDYTGLSVPDRYAMMQMNIAIYLLNKRGAEGQIQHIENGIHRNYGNADVPADMLKDIVPMAQVIR